LHRNCLLKHVIEGKIEVKKRKEEGVRSWWMNLRKKGSGI
jgi:hypothetical protein